MTRDEFNCLQVGDVVKIVDRRMRTPDGDSRWNSSGWMDRYFGRAATVVRRVIGFDDFDYVKLDVDQHDDECIYRDGWNWFPEMLESPVELYPVIEISGDVFGF